MKIKEVLDRTTTFFKEKGFSTARLDSELLIAKALNLSRVDLYVQFERPFTEPELETCRDYVRRRGQGEPVAYIVGKKGFYKYDFLVEPGVLIPRPETEMIIDTVLEWAIDRKSDDLRIVDLGSGSGCIGLSLLKEFPASKLIAVDCSSKALEVTQKNAEQLGVSDRLLLLEKSASDITAEDMKDFLGKADIVVSNPPYIEKESEFIETAVKEFEPHEALFADNEGYEYIEKWSHVAESLLEDSGLWCFEIGADQGDRGLGIVSEIEGFTDCRLQRDLSGLDRIISATKKEI